MMKSVWLNIGKQNQSKNTDLLMRRRWQPWKHSIGPKRRQFLIGELRFMVEEHNSISTLIQESNITTRDKQIKRLRWMNNMLYGSKNKMMISSNLVIILMLRSKTCKIPISISFKIKETRWNLRLMTLIVERWSSSSRSKDKEETLKNRETSGS